MWMEMVEMPDGCSLSLERWKGDIVDAPGPGTYLVVYSTSTVLPVAPRLRSPLL